MEIKKDADINFVREKSRYFLLSDTVTGLELSGKILQDALSLGLTHVECEVCDNWWVVAGATRWIKNSDEDKPISDLFKRIHPNPRAGANAMRGEVLLGAFADRIVVFEGDEATKILGPHGTLKSWAETCRAGRNQFGVAFTMPS